MQVSENHKKLDDLVEAGYRQKDVLFTRDAYVREGDVDTTPTLYVCPIGAAGIAVGRQRIDEMLHGDDDDELGDDYFIYLLGEHGVDLNEVAVHPETGSAMLLYEIIPELVDEHEWTDEGVVRWLRGEEEFQYAGDI